MLRGVRPPLRIVVGEREHGGYALPLEGRPHLAHEPLGLRVAHGAAAYAPAEGYVRGSCEASTPSGAPQLSIDGGIGMP